MSVILDVLHQSPHLGSVVGPQPRPGLDGVDPAGDVLQVLRQQVLRPGHDVERLRPVPPVTDLEVLVSDTDQTTVISSEHVGVQILENVDQQFAVIIVLRKLRRIHAFPHVDQTLVRQLGGHQDDPPLGVTQEVGDPTVRVLEEPVRAVTELLVVNIDNIVDIENVERHEKVPEFPIESFEHLCVREVDEDELLLSQPDDVLHLVNGEGPRDVLGLEDVLVRLRAGAEGGDLVPGTLDDDPEEAEEAGEEDGADERYEHWLREPELVWPEVRSADHGAGDWEDTGPGLGPAERMFGVEKETEGGVNVCLQREADGSEQ